MTASSAPEASLPRSYLYVPADKERFLESARSHGADAIILDLEDGVALSRKEAARALLREWLPRQRPGNDEIWIRVNPAHAAEDARLAAAECVDGIVLPKASASSLRDLDLALNAIELGGRRPAPLRVIPLIETAASLEDAADLAAAPRISRLGVGRADLLAELRVSARLPAMRLSSLWLRIVVASAAAGRAAPIAPVETRLHDIGALAATTAEFADLGFRARTAIHPEQVAPINQVFSPSAQQVSAARSLLQRFESHVAQGTGVFVDADGSMVDEAVVRSARAVLRRAEDAAATEAG